MTPSQLAIALRCGPSGPPFDLAAALANLGVSGNVTRIWNAPTAPGDDLPLPPTTRTVLQTIDVICTAAQLGRSYLAWWRMLLVPYDKVDPQSQPPAVLAEIAAVTVTRYMIGIGIKLAERIGGMDGPDVFPWIADGTGHCDIVPGVTGPPFVVGSNLIQLYVNPINIPSTALVEGSALTVVELDLAASHMLHPGPSEHAA